MPSSSSTAGGPVSSRKARESFKIPRSEPLRINKLTKYFEERVHWIWREWNENWIKIRPKAFKLNLQNWTAKNAALKVHFLYVSITLEAFTNWFHVLLKVPSAYFENLCNGSDLRLPLTSKNFLYDFYIEQCKTPTTNAHLRIFYFYFIRWNIFLLKLPR